MPICGQLQLLSSGEIRDIYDGALAVLENTGVKVPLVAVRQELKAAGCLVKDQRVRMPSALVAEMLAKAPGQFSIHARDPLKQVRIEERRVCFQPMIGRLNTLDSETGQKRRTTLADVRNLIRLADALPHYHILHSGAIMPHIEGIPDPLAHVYGYVASVANSAKVIKGTCRGRDKAIDCIRLAAVLAGGEDALRANPNIHTTYNIISPLEHGREMLEGMLEYIRYGLPVDITVEPQTGATSPVTLAGTLVQQCAELFSGVTITQIMQPETPVFIGTCGAAMDMRHGTIALGGIEAGLLNAAHAQMGRFVGIPTRGTGANTHAKILDFQAGYEKTMTLLMPALSGINMIFYPGTIEHAETISIESLLLDHEICSLTSRALQGITVNDDTVALDLIAGKGPGGFYFNERHTIDYLDSEHLMPDLADRRKREDWKNAGEQDLATVARHKVKAILAQHQPMPLDTTVQEELLRIVREVEKREGQQTNLTPEELFV